MYIFIKLRINEIYIIKHLFKNKTLVYTTLCLTLIIKFIEQNFIIFFFTVSYKKNEYIKIDINKY